MIIEDRFRLLHRLGEGGTSVVWAAERTVDGEPVAVKIGEAKERNVRRFQTEASVTGAIGGPHLVRVLGTGVLPDGRPWLAMDRLVGRDLGTAIRQDGPLAADHLPTVLGPVAEALHAAHVLGILHRDVKPENVFLHGPGDVVQVKLLDFGGQDVLGTPLYMSPEQAQRWTARIGRATDIWGFGMTALAALTGDIYWPGADTAERMAAIVRHPMYAPRTRWPWLPALFDGWFLTACARDPDDRFSDIRAASDALVGALVDAATPQPAPQRLPRSTTWSDEDEVAPRRVDRPAPVRGMLIGRDAPLAELVRVVADPKTRLVTVLGAGGVGKSAIAAHALAAASSAFADGICYVGMATVRGMPSAWSAIADALGAPGAGLEHDRTVLALARRRLLLCLDDADQFSRAAEVVSELLERCPLLVILATSRVPLGLPLEVRFALAPLAVPAPAESDPEVAAGAASVALFVCLAQRVLPSFELGPENVSAVCQIVRRFDGLPLAIELAAAHLRDHGPDAIVSRLESGVSLGDAADQNRPTVRTTLHWSWELLSPWARDLVEQLSLFQCGFEADSAEAVGRMKRGSVHHALTVLVEHSLVVVCDGRFSMLETVRGYAAERLGGRFDREAVELRWLDWAVDFAERFEVAQGGPEAAMWVSRAEAEHVTLRAALDAALARRDGTRAARIAGAFSGFWFLRGHYLEGSTFLDRALQLGERVPEAVRAKATATAGRLALLRCEYARAERLSASAAALYTQLGDEGGAVRAIEVSASVAREQGRYADAIGRHQRCVDLALASGDRRAWARATQYLAFAAWLSGDGLPARTSCPEALDVFRALGDVEGVSWSLLSQAGAALYCDADPDRSTRFASDALEHSRSNRYVEGEAWALDLLGGAALRRGEQATRLLRGSLGIHARLGDVWRSASVLCSLARAIAFDRQPERAARLLGAAEGLWARIEAPVPSVESADYERCASGLATTLGPGFAASRAAGARLGLARAVSLAGGDPDSHPTR